MGNIVNEGELEEDQCVQILHILPKQEATISIIEMVQNQEGLSKKSTTEDSSAVHRHPARSCRVRHSITLDSATSIRSAQNDRRGAA